MNYGGNKGQLYLTDVATDDSASDPFDLFGLKHYDRNKSRFHSLPMTYNTFENNDQSLNWHLYQQTVAPYLGADSATNDYKLEYIRKRNSQRNILGNADPFGKENFQEVLYGNDLNAKLGNITFQPYVRVEEISLDEASEYSVTKWIKGG